MHLKCCGSEISFIIDCCFLKNLLYITINNQKGFAWVTPDRETTVCCLFVVHLIVINVFDCHLFFWQLKLYKIKKKHRKIFQTTPRCQLIWQTSSSFCCLYFRLAICKKTFDNRLSCRDFLRNQDLINAST